jgi:diguanylate cyclase (GGDEF)-like protein
MRGGWPLSLLFIDLDGFKQINDIHGHLLGSRALIEAAQIIRSCARETDVVARFGGDEFAMLLPETGLDGAHAVARRVRDRLQRHLFLADHGPGNRISASNRTGDPAGCGRYSRRAASSSRCCDVSY